MPQHFHGWSFCDQLHTARSDGGQEIRFTRQERAVLAELMGQPHTLITRARLLEVLPRPEVQDADPSPRHADYLVNRLRRHLGDTARNPRFIATQYGDGYRWIATPVQTPTAADGAFLVICPLHRHMPPAAQALAQTLCHALNARIQRPPGGGAGAAIAPPPPWQPAPGSGTAYLLEMSAWADPTTLHAALLLRDARTRQSLHPLRATHLLAHGQGEFAAQGNAHALADTLHQHIWAHQAMALDGQAPTDTPLEMRLHEATRLFGEPHATWRESLAHVEQLDHGCYMPPVRDIGRALALLTRIMLQSPRTQCLSPQEWDAHEAEIEQLVLPHLPAIAGQPLLELAAARLLGSIGEQHAATAFELAHRGFAGTTAFAAAFPTLGQRYAHAGDFGTAHTLYERSIELAEPGTEFHIYLLTLRCLACLGSGDREALARCREDLFAAKPATRQEMGFLLHSPDAELPPDVAAVLPLLPEAILRPMVYLIQRKTRTLFQHPEHRANMLRGFATHLARRVGPHALPQELQALAA